MAIRYPMAVGLNKGYKVTKNVSKPRQCRRRGVSMSRARACVRCGAVPVPRGWREGRAQVRGTGHPWYRSAAAAVVAAGKGEALASCWFGTVGPRTPREVRSGVGRGAPELQGPGPAAAAGGMGFEH